MTTWKFDANVASRFQEEARSHIPDYDRVIDICLKHSSIYSKNSVIIEVGSALGHTIDKYIQAGYKTVLGVESSLDMINQSKHSNRIIHSNVFPNIYCDIVLINWTLHFIKHKEEYLQSVFKYLNNSGLLILTEKTKQSPQVKEAYYNFKRSNGVSDEYIYAKERQLADSMYIDDTQYYINTLNKIGFKYVEVINSKLGFVTFLCHK